MPIRLPEALRVMNEVAHGVDVDVAATEHAVSIGTAFLAELQGDQSLGSE